MQIFVSYVFYIHMKLKYTLLFMLLFKTNLLCKFIIHAFIYFAHIFMVLQLPKNTYSEVKYHRFEGDF